MFSVIVTTVNYKILNRYEYETGGRDTPFIFRRGYVSFGYKNAALFCTKNSLFEMLEGIRECSAIRKLA